jgi:hypothetical protein
MPRNCDINVGDSDIVVERELHTKYATPGRLSRELEDLLGSSGFQVEVRNKWANFFSKFDSKLTDMSSRCAITSITSNPLNPSTW